jgi:hypothetical protein
MVKSNGVDAEPLQVIERRGCREIADAVAVAVHKRAQINLVNDAALPPTKFLRSDSM